MSTSSTEKVYSSFIKASGTQKGCKPGFGHALKLSYNTIDPKRLSGDAQSLTYRYKLSPDVPKFTLSLLTAIMDELSTDAIFHMGNPSPPGLSVHLQTELVSIASLDSYDELDVVNVITKLGRKLAFTRTEFICPQTKELVAVSTHIKYLPTGSIFMDAIFTSPMLWDFFHHIQIRSFKVPFFEEKPLFEETIKKNLEYKGPSTATFQVTKEHTNPFGSLHGGCHAILMETVAETFAKAQLKCDKVRLDEIDVEYLGIGKDTMAIVCQTLGASTTGVLRVQVELRRAGRVSSRGKLRFSVTKGGGNLQSNM
eukprot:Nitzschia sp. Nitz4//scaffold103_size77763//13148//14080//NITZ4_005440-RA/size77763-processed-gene-0.4-mRNA-1//1//CDS//3329532313//4408//frame0